MTERVFESVGAFHRSRTMFAIHQGQIVLGDRASSESHLDWFIRMGWVKTPYDPSYGEMIRGYSDGRDIFAYRGEDFLDDAPVETAMRYYGAELKKLLGLSASAQIFLGALKGEPGKPWAFRRRLC